MASIPFEEQVCLPAGAASEKSTYGEILKSTVLVGGSSVVNIAMGVVRTKTMAVLLGPAGFGLASLFTAVSNLAQNVAGLGVNSSGVRQIAEAAGSEDKDRIVITAAVLRRISVLLGVLGAAVLVVFCRQVSVFTFGTTQQAAAVSLLAPAIFLNLVSAGQKTLIQGLRQISELAQIGVLGAILGTAATLPIVYVLRQRGIVPSLVAVAALSLLTSSWYARKVRLPRCSFPASRALHEAKALLTLGFALMSSGLMTMGSAYLVRIAVLRKLGLEATGFYQAAWTLGGLYVSVVLQAMGADFFPRLMARANDNATCNRVVNEQARISLLLAGPGVIGTLTCAPLVIALFYSAKFHASIELLRWICLGAALQVITWPMGFIIIAKGRQAVFFWCEAAWAVVTVSLAWVCVERVGLNGAGMAFFGSYIFHLLLIYPVVNRMSGFRWSMENKRTTVLYLSLFALVFGAFHALPFMPAECIGAVALILSGTHSVRALFRLTPAEDLPAPLRRFAVSFGLTSPSWPIIG